MTARLTRYRRAPFWWVMLVMGLMGLPKPTHAQSFSDWQDGVIILATGDTLAGKLFLNLEADLLEVEYNQAIKAFTPLQVLLVRFDDPPRLFASHPAALKGTMEIPTFFEVIYPGAHYTLLCRDRLGQNNAPIVDQYGQPIGSFYGTQNYKHDYFVLNARGKVRKMPGRRQDLARFLDAAKPEALEEYIRQHKPDPAKQDDMVGLIAFYNHLRSGQPGVK